ncbi:MAG: UvrD-helicase domain-containing protein [Clostridia bacterium]|nr:UvrD-helicase domain-containing protein [Clostridia bacterium]
MERKWTPAQSAAMSTLGRTLLISAAAGSGKTATLTERIIRRLTDPVHPADLSRMLIVTFTRAAAAELRERISGALTQAIAKDPGNKHLQKQLIGLGGAHISTIDAFCREPVKLHFAEVGLPAASRIADDAELLPLCERVMDELIHEFYVKYAPKDADPSAFALLRDNPFADLCDSLSPSKNDSELIPTLLSLYNRLLSFPEELERLKMEAEALSAEGNAENFEFFRSAHGRIIREWVVEFTNHAVAVLETALEDIDADPAAAKAYSAAFTHDLAFCRLLAEADSYGAAFDLLNGYQNLRLGALRNAPAEITAHKEARAEIVDDIKALRDTYFVDAPASVAEQMRVTAKLCEVLYDFLTEYDRRILAEKKNRGICDFTDNRRYLLNLLRDSKGQPSGMALEYRDRFDEVYIDEYQDVDEMQDEIFRLVGDNHRFMVGDIKQSIYGFRGADPSVFARYRRDLTTLYEEDGEWKGHDEEGNSIFMSENFRCDESVIRVTNAVCGHMFRACPHSIAYEAGDDLGFAKKTPFDGYESPAVQVSVLVKPPKTKDEVAVPSVGDEEMSGVEAEATYVAGEIARLLRSGTKLASGEPVKPSDIVILMRSRTALSAYMKALTAAGIPTGSEELEAAEAGRDILHGSDMSYLVNLLRVIDNPDSDIPLSEVLRAPFPGLDLEELITLRNVGDRRAESRSLYAGVEEYAARPDADPVLADKLNRFRDWLEDYRRLTSTRSAEALLRLLRQDDNCACRQTAAFLYLYESARTCRASTFVSLYAFLRYFESKLATTKNAPAPNSGKDGGHVSIMTIHKSKGLEFPVCFVVRCGQYFSARSMSEDLIFEKRAGASMKLYRRMADGEDMSQFKTDTTLRAASALAVKIAEREEEMRVLYVAMTRARERLYLVGVGNGKPVSFGEGDRFATLSCNCYLKWVLGGIAAHPELGRHVSVEELMLPDVLPPVPLQWSREQDSNDSDGHAARYREVLERAVPLTPMEQALRRVPTKVPASRMKEGMLDTCVFYDTDLESGDGKLPDSGTEGSWCDAQTTAAIRQSLSLMQSCENNEFELLLSENRRPTASEKGTAAHLILQYCDYNRVHTHGLDSEIARLAELGFITDRTATIPDRGALEAFFASPFFGRVKEAAEVKRELRFSRFVPLASLTKNAELAEALGDKTLFVQGSIDLLLIFADGHMEICDYKTDRITEAERGDPSLLQKRMQETHADQLRQYSAAVAESYGQAPTKVYIYSLPLGDAVEIFL